MVRKVKKRDGRVVAFSYEKILNAIKKCVDSMDSTACDLDIEDVTEKVVSTIHKKYKNNLPSVEDIQDIVEDELMNCSCHNVAKKYILYRQERTVEREKHTKLMNIMDGIFRQTSEENDLKRDNANTNTDTPMGTMLKIGSEASKEYYFKRVLKKEYAKAHQSGLIHIHDLDFHDLTTTCCQIDLEKLLRNGFSTGVGSIRPPKSIRAATALVAITLQSNQNDQHR